MQSALLLLQLLCADSRTIRLRTSGFVPRISGRSLQGFLATPSNWPRIVLSSQSVEGIATNVPMKAGDSVDEIFGAPPVLPLSVNWKCDRNDYPNLDMVSYDGLAGVARDCKMSFNIKELGEQGSRVDFEMVYTPSNILARLAIPILYVDNALAIKFLLPQAVQEDMSPERPIDRFRKLMGVLYGVAGVAHALDLFVGPNALFGMAGLAPFKDLPMLGQLLAVLWCLAGPLAYVCTRNGGRAAGLGLALYGGIELGCAEIASAAVEGSPELNIVQNAFFVQVAVVLSWIYSNYKSGEQS